jgi:hypothetical protein
MSNFDKFWALWRSEHSKADVGTAVIAVREFFEREIANLEGIDKACDAANAHVIALERDLDAAVALRTKEAAALCVKNSKACNFEFRCHAADHGDILALLSTSGTEALAQHDAELIASLHGWLNAHEVDALITRKNDEMADKVNQLEETLQSVIRDHRHFVKAAVLAEAEWWQENRDADFTAREYRLAANRAAVKPHFENEDEAVANNQKDASTPRESHEKGAKK